MENTFYREPPPSCPHSRQPGVRWLRSNLPAFLRGAEHETSAANKHTPQLQPPPAPRHNLQASPPPLLLLPPPQQQNQPPCFVYALKGRS